MISKDNYTCNRLMECGRCRGIYSEDRARKLVDDLPLCLYHPDVNPANGYPNGNMKECSFANITDSIRSLELALEQ